METKVIGNLEIIYENITKVVNLKCEECHVKLKDFLESLTQNHLKIHTSDLAQNKIKNIKELNVEKVQIDPKISF